MAFFFLYKINVLRCTEVINPDFVNAPYEFWVGSDVPVGTSVGQVRIVSENPSIDYDLLHTYQEGGKCSIQVKNTALICAMCLCNSLNF